MLVFRKLLGDLRLSDLSPCRILHFRLDLRMTSEGIEPQSIVAEFPKHLWVTFLDDI